MSNDQNIINDVKKYPYANRDATKNLKHYMTSTSIISIMWVVIGLIAFVMTISLLFKK